MCRPEKFSLFKSLAFQFLNKCLVDSLHYAAACWVIRWRKYNGDVIFVQERSECFPGDGIGIDCSFGPILQLIHWVTGKVIFFLISGDWFIFDFKIILAKSDRPVKKSSVGFVQFRNPFQR